MRIFESTVLDIVDDGQEDGSFLFSTASDVYSFGMLMWQCCARNDNFYVVYQRCRTRVEAANKIREMILDGQRPNTSYFFAPVKLQEIIENCWETDPVKRPSLAAVIEVLKDLDQSQEPDCPFPVKRMCKEKWFDVKSMYL